MLYSFERIYEIIHGCVGEMEDFKMHSSLHSLIHWFHHQLPPYPPIPGTLCRRKSNFCFVSGREAEAATSDCGFVFYFFAEEDFNGEFLPSSSIFWSLCTVVSWKAQPAREASVKAGCRGSFQCPQPFLAGKQLQDTLISSSRAVH